MPAVIVAAPAPIFVDTSQGTPGFPSPTGGTMTVQGVTGAVEIPVVSNDNTATGVLNGLNISVPILLVGATSTGFQLAAGTLVGTIVPEISFDGGATWIQTFFDSPTTNSKVSSIVFSSSNAATAQTIVGAGGAGLARVRVSAYTSGTANITIRASQIDDPSVLFAGPTGATGAAPPTIAQVGGADPSNTLRALSVDTSGRPNVRLTDGINGPVTVKAANTAPTGPDQSLVVSLSSNSPLTAQSSSDFEPAPDVIPGPPSYLNVDPAGNLFTRGPVLSDEGSLYDCFQSTLTSTLTGTLTFVNGSKAVTGTGTSFTTQILIGQYVKLSADSETAFAQVSAVLSNTSLTLVNAYTGTSTTGTSVVSNWATRTGSGGSITESASNLAITNGLGNGTSTYLFRAIDYGPLAVSFHNVQFLSGVANQTAYMGLQDNPTSMAVQAVVQFDGALPTNQVRFIVQNSTNANDIVSQVITLPYGLSVTAELYYRISVTVLQAVLEIGSGTQPPIIVATSPVHFPSPYLELSCAAGMTNSAAVGSTATLNIDSITIINHNRIEVMNSFGEPLLVVPSPTTGVNSGTGTISALNGFIAIPITGTSNAVVLVTGTWVGTLTVQFSVDGTNWITDDVLSTTTGGFVSSITSNATLEIVLNAYKSYRVIATAWTSGTATVSYNTSPFPALTLSQTYITDASNNGPAAVTPPNVTATAAQPALVVQMSPNQPAIPVSIQAVAGSVTGIGIGYVTTTSTSQTWVNASTYNEQTANGQRSVSSASANDTSAGTGAQKILISYLDTTGAGPTSETVTMNGTTAVNTVGTTIAYVDYILVSQVGSGAVNAGVITLFISTAGGGGTFATINASDNRSFWGHHYTPTGKTENVTGLSGNNTSSSNGSVLVLKAKTLNLSGAVEYQVSDFVRVGGGTAQPVREYTQLIKFTGPCRMRVYESCEGTPSIVTRAAFDFYDQ